MKPFSCTPRPIRSCLLAILFVYTVNAFSQNERTEQKPYHDRYIVKLHNASLEPGQKAFVPKQANIKTHTLSHSALQIWETFPESLGKNEWEKWDKHPDIAWIEPDYAINALSLPDDPELYRQWGLYNPDGQSFGSIQADKAWLIRSEAPEIVIGVIDSGIDWSHPDLVDNIWQNLREDADGDGRVLEFIGNRWVMDPDDLDGIDNDQNGYADDLIGWDFVNEDNNPYDDNVTGHGTHVAGIIGARGNNGIGISGVCMKIKLMPLKILNQLGSGFTSDAIEALTYSIRMGANISNNSWGNFNYSRALFETIQMAADANHLYIAAAGNNANDNDRLPLYPAGYDLANLISVTATDKNDKLTAFSNIGKNSVDLAAPGYGIYSTLPGGGFGYISGTSMAAPFVSGAAALLLAKFPGTEPAAIKNHLSLTADPIQALMGKSKTESRLNLFTALSKESLLPYCNVRAQFLANVLAVCEGQALTFVNQSPDASGYIWLVNGDTVSFEKDLTYVFTEKDLEEDDDGDGDDDDNDDDDDGDDDDGDGDDDDDDDGDDDTPTPPNTGGDDDDDDNANDDDGDDDTPTPPNTGGDDDDDDDNANDDDGDDDTPTPPDTGGDDEEGDDDENEGDDDDEGGDFVQQLGVQAEKNDDDDDDNLVKVTLIAKDGSCAGSISQFIQLILNPKLNVPDTSICARAVNLDAGVDEGIQGYYWFNVEGDTLGNDNNITIKESGVYSLEVSNFCGERFVQEDIVVSLEGDCVWPGDVTQDGQVNMDDLFAIGIAYGAGGPARSSIDTRFIAQEAPSDWNTSFANDYLLAPGFNHKYADCNGDGTVDDKDILVVQQNANIPCATNGENPNTPTASLSLETTQQSLRPGEPFTFSIKLQNEDGSAVENVYGVSFGIEYNIPSKGAGGILTQNSWLGDTLKNLAVINVPGALDARDQSIRGVCSHIGMTRLDKQPISGNGEIAALKIIIIIDDVGQQSLPPQNAFFSLSLLNPVLTRTNGEIIPINQALSQSSLSVPVTVRPETTPSGIQIYPNPSQGQVMVNIPQATGEKYTVKVIDLMGRIRYSAILPQNTSSNPIPLSLDTLRDGVYIISVYDNARILKQEMLQITK